MSTCLVALTLIHSVMEALILAPIQGSQGDKEESKSGDYSPDSIPQTTGAPVASPTVNTVTSSIPSAATNTTIQPPEYLVGNLTLRNPVLTNQSASFVDRWCDLRKTPWYPTDAQTQQKPYFLIPGAKFAGTTVLTQMLLQHPHLVAPKPTPELGFFLDGSFRFVNHQEKTLVGPARQRLATHFPHRHALSFDASPGYLFYSSLIPRRILCVVPWVKLVVLLRHPIDRALEQYRWAQRKGYRGSEETYVQRDFDLLQRVGVITNSS